MQDKYYCRVSIVPRIIQQTEISTIITTTADIYPPLGNRDRIPVFVASTMQTFDQFLYKMVVGIDRR